MIERAKLNRIAYILASLGSQLKNKWQKDPALMTCTVFPLQSLFTGAK